MRPNPLILVLAISLAETIAEAVTSRGIFYYTTDVLHFRPQSNLILSLTLSMAGATASLFAYRLVDRVGQRRALMALLAARAAAELVMCLWPHTGVLVIAGAARQACGGAIWPVISNYATAGRPPVATGRAIGWFNLSWAIGIPLGMLVVGRVMQAEPSRLFLLGAAGHAAILPLVALLTPEPPRLVADHPDRIKADDLPRFRALLVSSRWSQLQSSTVMTAVVALAPGMFIGLGYTAEHSAYLMMLSFDLARFLAFAGLIFFVGWHGRLLPQALIAAGLPFAAIAVLTGWDTASLVAGLFAFGVLQGAAYYTGLYYGMVVHDHSVQAAGRHEGLGALGGVLGPGVGALGNRLGAFVGGARIGTALGIGLLSACCSTAALWPLLRLRAGATPAAPQGAD